MFCIWKRGAWIGGGPDEPRVGQVFRLPARILARSCRARDVAKGRLAEFDSFAY
jgi:hypothetical protein